MSPDTRRPAPRSRIDLSTIRETSWPVVLAVVVVAAAYPVVVWSNLPLVETLTRPIVAATGGLVRATLLVYLPLILLVAGLVLWVGRLRLRDLGLRRDALRTGVAVTVAAWLVMQAVGAAALAWAGAPVRINEGWFAVGVLAAVGPLLAQLLGNALYEEVVFRGFLLTQLHHRFRRRLAGAPRWAFLAALVVSQVTFALIHVPNRMVSQGLSIAELPLALVLPLVFGLLLALVYYRTGNLFVAIGLHAFANTPTMVVGSDGVGITVVFVLTVLVAVAWPWFTRVTGFDASTEADVRRQSAD